MFNVLGVKCDSVKDDNRKAEEKSILQRELDKVVSIEEMVDIFEMIHRRYFETWGEGKRIEYGLDDNNNICIKYESGKWWHYRLTNNGEIEYW